MASETQEVQGRIDGRRMLDLAVEQYNAGVDADGLHEILTIHHATQQLLESRTMGNNGTFRVDDAGFLATTANGEFIRRYLGGFIDNDETVPKLRVDDEGKIRTFGSMRVSTADLDFDLVSTFEQDGSMSATFQWFREMPETSVVEQTQEVAKTELSVKKLTHREKTMMRASAAIGACCIAVFAVGFKLSLTGEGEKAKDTRTGETITLPTESQELGMSLMEGSALILGTQTLTLAIMGRREEYRRHQAAIADS